MKQYPQLKEFIVAMTRQPNGASGRTASPPPELVKKFEDGKKSIKKIGGVQDDKSDELTW